MAAKASKAPKALVNPWKTPEGLPPEEELKLWRDRALRAYDEWLKLREQCAKVKGAYDELLQQSVRVQEHGEVMRTILETTYSYPKG